MNRSFWNQPLDWPVDFPSHIFLARAFIIVGRQLFGAEWSAEVRCPPDHFTEDFRRDSASLNFDDGGDDVDDDDYAFDELDDSTTLDKWKLQFWEVADLIAKACLADPPLSMAIRPAKGGELVNLAPGDWRTEPNVSQARFDRCQIDRKKRFRLITSGKANSARFRSRSPLRRTNIASDPCWIYIERNSFNRFLETIPSAEEAKRLQGREACLEWLAKEMALHPATNETKAQWAKKARDKFGVTKTAFLKIRAEAMQKTGRITWGRGGRKKGTKNR